MDQIEISLLGDEGSGDTAPGDWLGALIRDTLRSTLRHADPPRTTWARIRQQVLCSQQEERMTEGCEMLGWTDILAQEEHRKELRREAAETRLVRQALARRPRRGGRRGRMMRWIGGRLVAWGSRLQERYGNSAGMPTLRPANSTR